MSLARRFMMSSGLVAAPGQAEFTSPGIYDFVVPPGVFWLDGVAIGAGAKGSNSSPFPGGSGAGLHWRNKVAVTPGEILTVTVGTGQFPTTFSRESSVKRGAEFLWRAASGSSLGNKVNTYHGQLGGGGGRGGAGGGGGDGNGGCGGGGPGYMGDGGRGGNYLDTSNGQLPDPNSGGGRGGDINGVPYGWASARGEGTGLLGRKPDFSGSLGDVRCGAGDFPTSSGGQDGGIRLMWGAGRSYPDNAPNVASGQVAEFISAANGSAVLPTAFTVHQDAQPGDLVVLYAELIGSGSYGGVTGGTGNWGSTGRIRWKQLTQADIDASIAGTLRLAGSGTMAWIAAVYRGPRIAASRAGMVVASDTVTIPGFAKRVDCQRVLLTVLDDDGGAAIAAPPGFTPRGSRTAPRRMLLADAAPAAYADSSDVVLTGMNAAGTTWAYLAELY